MIRAQNGWMTALGVLLILAFAWQPAEGRKRGTVTVVGEGQVSVRPDVARMNLGVVAGAPTVRAAMQMNREAMEKVLAVLEELGVDEKDIATSNFSIQFRTDSESRNQAGSEKEGRYHVSNMVRVTVRQLDAIDRILEGATEAGANQVWGVQMAVDEPREAEKQARKLAVEQAYEKALELAGLHSRKLGKVIEISEVIGGSPRMSVQRFDLAKGGAIRPGEQEIGINLQVIYELD